MKQVRQFIIALSLVILPSATLASSTTTHYRFDPDPSASFGGQGSSTDYRLVDSGGEAAVGSGSSSSYKLTAGYAAQMAQSMQLTVMPNGIVGYYPLDTGTGTQAYDNSTNQNDGATVNAPSWVAGKIGQGLSFNGTTQRVDIPDSASLGLTGDLTIEAWVNPTDYANVNELVTKMTGNGLINNMFELRVQQTTGTLQFLAFDTALRTITSTGTVPTGTWTHVAVTKTGGSAQLYINGLPDGNGAVGTAATNAKPVRLGTRDSLSQFLKGSLDEVKIFNRALSSAEIAGEYAAANNGISSAQVIPAIIPGASQNTTMDAVVRTDAGGYDLAINQDHNLLHTNAVNTITGIASTIASPAAWTEGTTKGLGFTLTGGSQIEAKWGTNPNYAYAALPNTATTFHSRTGLLGAVPEKNSVQYRLDTTTAQLSGSYSSTVTVTATLKP